jgi:uncharacterized protein (TIGR00251 family)
MRIRVIVKPNAKQQQILTAADGSLVVRLKSPPVDGKANAELIKLLAKHYRVRRSQITLLHGQTARQKLLDIHFD